MKDILIIGAGPAGLTASIYAARAGMSVLVFDKVAYGGQTILTDRVDNFPGMQGVPGVDFAQSLYEQAVSQGAEVVLEEVQAVELDGEIKRVTTSERVYEGHAVILANGSVQRRLGCAGETEYTGHGVSYCATCDAAFFRGKEVAIVGGGDTALDDALFLSNNCAKVTLIHRRGEFRGEKVKQEAVMGRLNVEILYSSTVSEIGGDGKRVEYCMVETPSGLVKLEVSAVFIAVGLMPMTELYKDMIPLSPEGYALAGEDCATPFPGVWVAGDIRKKPLRQIVTAAADGAVAAVAAAEYCSKMA